MGNAIGACTGTLTGSCLAGVLTAGDLSNSHWGVRAGIDSLLVLSPTMLWGYIGSGNQLVLGTYILSTAIAAFVPNKYYGAKVLGPVLLTAPAAILGYQLVDISTVHAFAYISYLVVITLSVLAAIMAADCGSMMTVAAREWLHSFRHMPRWEVVLKLILAKLAIVTLLYTIWMLQMDWCANILACVLVLLSVLETPDNAPPTSIISAALVLATLELLASQAECQMALVVLISMLAVYNNVLLNVRAIHVNKGELLLPIADVQAAPQVGVSVTEISVWNSALGVAQFVWIQPTLFPDNQYVFEVVYLVISMWTLIAPRVFPHRQFN